MSDESVNGAAQLPATEQNLKKEIEDAMRAGLGPDAYKHKLCPYLTATAPQGKPGELSARACVGPNCMFFTPISEPPDGNKPGKIIDGQCAIALIPTSVSMLTNTIVMITQQPARVAPLVHAGPGNIPRKR